MRPLPASAPTRKSATPAADACVARADRVIAAMRAGGTDAADAGAWRPARSPWL